IAQVFGDRYAGEWPREQFRHYGVNYEPADKTKSDLYIDLLPLLNSRNIDLLDNERLISQITGLERKTARSGKDSIDHSPGGQDDLAKRRSRCCGLCRPSRWSETEIHRNADSGCLVGKHGNTPAIRF